jgi:hypothetical protein
LAAEHPALAPWLDKWEIEDDCDWKEILERTKEVQKYFPRVYVDAINLLIFFLCAAHMDGRCYLYD